MWSNLRFPKRCLSKSTRFHQWMVTHIKTIQRDLEFSSHNRRNEWKHVRIEWPKHSGSPYYTYKGFYSFVLLAVCDANYCFTLFDVGQYGSNNDAGVLAHSKLGNLLDENKPHVPESSCLDGCNDYLTTYLTTIFSASKRCYCALFQERN